MEPFVEFVSRLIFGTGGQAIVTPNHQAWLQANPTPSGTAWIGHHVDSMLTAYRAWLATNHLPPIVPWDGTDTRPWDVGIEVPLPLSLDGSFTGVSTLDNLGVELRNRFNAVSSSAQELGGSLKAPFSYRYWGYMQWAANMRDRFNGAIIVPASQLYDRDGTPLSAIDFSDVFNQLHFNWHHVGSPPTATAPTPGFSSSAGQYAGSGGVGMGSGEEFLYFHRDHYELFSRWLDRTGQPPVRGRNLHNAGQGWPASGAGTPSTWVEGDNDPWINTETGDTDGNLRTSTTSPNDLGNDISGVHGAGHGLNSDIGSISHNNYVPRFQAWHGWIDNQLWWREPRFANWDTTTGLRNRVFEPVLSTGAAWPALAAVTIVRDPAAAADAVSPANGVAGVNLTSGAGTLRMRFHVADSYNRRVRLRLTAEVFDDAASTTTPTETIPATSNTYVVGSVAGGDDFDLGTDFTVDFAFTTAFRSDDPTRSGPAVGFENSRIRISGVLDMADGTDTGFVHRDHTDIALVQEKQGPEVDLFFDLSSFGEDQVVSATAGGVARFSDALIVVVQDRTSQPAPPVWPAQVANEVKGLVQGWIPAAGLFGDAAHAPTVALADSSTNTAIAGLSAELSSGPVLEDPSLADNRVQRYTYRYDIVFQDPNGAFTGLATGGQRFATVTVTTADRAGNAGSSTGQIKLFREANPYMRDDQPSWLSIDTRVFRLFQGETKFGTALGADPTAYIQQVIQNLNAGSTGGDTFDGLPTKQADSALEYSTSITNPSTGIVQNVFNFALAKVRLQGANGAANVRAFFRLFRYTATNLIFDSSLGYRTHDDGAGKKIPKLGFSAAAPGGDVTSIPFFAAPRLAYTQPMTNQADGPNVQSFPAGPTTERVLYFGAYLDINQTGARLPDSYIAANPDGGFAVGDVQSIRSLMLDAHQCMVVEVNYDGDPTVVGDTPAGSDNLAQRNLQILYTDNPGAVLTHTVQHSFEVDVGRRRRDQLMLPRVEFAASDAEDRALGESSEEPTSELASAIDLPLRFLTQEQVEERVHEEAWSLAINKATNMMEMMNPALFVDDARRLVGNRFPLVFDSTHWARTDKYFDELLIDWGDLPPESRVELYLPGINCEHVVNLRNLRHAPGDVRIVDSHTLQLTPGGVTYLPLPPGPGGKIPGIVTIALPDGIERGQEWDVNVIQLRGAEHRTTGGFQMHLEVSDASLIAEPEARLLATMFERLSLLDRNHPWHPILTRRVNTIRGRAEALAEAAGIEWSDPTVFTNPDTGEDEPVRGPALRVVLDKIQILDDRDPWIKGKAELTIGVRVHTPANGGITRETRLPSSGVFSISDKPGQNVLELDTEIFRGHADDELRVQVVLTEHDTFDPDDLLGKYTRVLSGPPEHWFGEYGPDGKAVDPEDMIYWRLWYRVEKA